MLAFGLVSVLTAPDFSLLSTELVLETVEALLDAVGVPTAVVDVDGATVALLCDDLT